MPRRAISPLAPGRRIGRYAPPKQGNRTMRVLLALSIAISLAGCQTNTPTTASGSPEITVTGARPDQVKPQLVNAILNRGLRLRTDSPFQIVAERKWGGAGGAAVLGALLSSDASDVIERISFSIADTGAGTRIVADRYMVKYAGTGRETANPANNAPGLDSLQGTLDAMAPALGAVPVATAAPPQRGT